MSVVQWWLLLAAGFLLLACVELYLQLRQKTSLWKALRVWFTKILDIVTGGI